MPWYLFQKRNKRSRVLRSPSVGGWGPLPSRGAAPNPQHWGSGGHESVCSSFETNTTAWRTTLSGPARIGCGKAEQMARRWRYPIWLLMAMLSALSGSAAAAGGAAADSRFSIPLTGDQRILQALDRL